MTLHDVAVGVVGATGVTGQDILRQLRERAFPCRTLRLFGTERTAGARVEEQDASGTIELLAGDAGSDLEVVFLAGGPRVARTHGPRLARAGVLVIDVSSAFRDDPGVPLVVPEVNATEVRAVGGGIIAIPSPTTSLLAAVVAPLVARWAVTRVIVSTYQGAGSAGTRAVRELARDTLALLGGRGRSIGARSGAFDCVPVIGSLHPGGESGHERAVARELARVLGAATPPIQLTAVRAPVLMGMAASVVVELGAPAPLEDVRAALRVAPGLLVADGDGLPTPRSVTGSPAVHVARVRADPSHPSAVALWAAMDAVGKGRAVSAVATAEIALRRGS